MMDKKRRHIRFNSDPNTFVAVKVGEDKPVTGMALTESQGGCSAVFIKNNLLQEKLQCFIKVGDMYPLQAEVRWVKKVDEDLIKVGFLFLE